MATRHREGKGAALKMRSGGMHDPKFNAAPVRGEKMFEREKNADWQYDPAVEAAEKYARSGQGLQAAADRQDPYEVLALAAPTNSQANRGAASLKIKSGAGSVHQQYGGAAKAAKAKLAPLPAVGDWGGAFADPSLPLLVDVGCGTGMFVLRCAWEDASAAEMDAALSGEANEMRDEQTTEDGRTQKEWEERGGATGEDGGAGAISLEQEQSECQVCKKTNLIQHGSAADRYLVCHDCGLRQAKTKDEQEGRKAWLGRRNYLGLEIREGLVRAGLDFAESLKLRQRCCFWLGNVDAAWWAEHMATYPGEIQLVGVQLPDPRLEKNMRKRGGSKGKRLTQLRLLQPSLVQAIVPTLSLPSKWRSPGLLYVSSDYGVVADEMFRFCLEVEGGGLAVATAEAIEGIRVLGDCSSGGLQCLTAEEAAGAANEGEGTRGGGAHGGAKPATAGAADDAVAKEEDGRWLRRNPFGCPTERECKLMAKTPVPSTIWRAVFSRAE